MGQAIRWLGKVVRGRPDGTRARLRRWLRGASEATPAPSPPPVPAAPPVPAGFRAVLPAAELVEGALVEVMAGDVPLVLCRVAGTVHAISGVCPHAGGPIGEGALEGHTVTCPLHGWSFDVRDGACFVDRTVRLPRWTTREVGGQICVGDPIAAVSTPDA